MDEPLDTKRRQIDERLSELRPLVEEHRLLGDALAVLGPVKGSARKHASRNAPCEATDDATRGTTAARVLSAVRENPGITAPKLAARLEEKPSEIYRVLQELKRKGKVASRRGWFHAEVCQLRGTHSRRRSSHGGKSGVGA